jgi:transposase InsO family protein
MEGCTEKEMKQAYYDAIQQMGKRFSTEWLCQLYGVSRSGYYRWRSAAQGPNRYQILHQQIDHIVKEEHSKHPSYGYRSIRAVILRETGWILSGQAVLKSMHRLHIRSKARRKRYRLVGKEHTTFPNILNRQFRAPEPLTHIAADISHLHMHGKRCFLAAYLDMFSNEIVSWALGRKEDMALVLEPLKTLLRSKRPDKPMLIHSDQGTQYTSYAYIKSLRDHGVVQSMSRAGTPRDNAVMESCLGWFKEMLYHDFHFAHAIDAETSLSDAVHHFNTTRPAFALNYKTPAQFKLEQGFY